jgi:AcrR family transcriptional regulator
MKECEPQVHCTQKESIIQRAFALFSLRGIAEVGVQEICNDAHISKPTLYYWFENKENLIKEVVKSVTRPFLCALANSCIWTGDIEVDLQRIVRLYFSWSIEHTREYLWFLSGLASPPESIMARFFIQYGREQHGLLQDLFGRFASKYERMRGKDSYLALSFIGVINAYILGAHHENHVLDDSDVDQAIKNFLFGVFS